MPDDVRVGYRALTAPDPIQDVRVPVHVLYPTDAAPQPQTFGPYSFEAARDAPIDARDLPLVVVSHGKTGTPWSARWLALPLARAGLVVALVEHVGDSRNDSSLTETPANLANRPRHIRLALDAVLADAALAPHIDATRISAVGHSIGGYTVLAVAGGKPLALPNQTPDGTAHPVPVEPDPRVRAVVVLAPALPWLMAPGALANVHSRVLARAAERDELAPPHFIERVLTGLPATARLDYAVVPGAGHFAFWGPVPPMMAQLPPGQDPPGFDRSVYQPRAVDEILAFLRS
jgi:predicted dienelactone hydrolase